MNSGMHCSGCGSTNVTFDPQRRILICNQCGKEEYYSRATLNANGKVAFSRDNAINFFKAGRYDMAAQYSRDVINIARDNIPALYMMAYYDEFILGKMNSLASFFTYSLDIALEYDEIIEMMQLFLAAPHSLIDFEGRVILLLAKNLQDPKDAPVLCDFFDKLCPYLIAKRNSINFLTAEMAENYAELAAHCGIPKTCFALLNAIQANPDSPYATNQFYMKARVQHFLDCFVEPIGKVIDAMQNGPYKEKFQKAFAQRRNKLIADASAQQ